MSTVPLLDDLLLLPPIAVCDHGSAVGLARVRARNVPIPDWHRDILEQRLAADETDQSPGESWPEVRRRIERR